MDRELGIAFWKDKWDIHEIGFHKLEVHHMLQKHSSLLFKEGDTQKFFIPLCGKTVDMKWLLDQGQVVVGLDGVKQALDEFCQEQNLDVTEEEASKFGPDYQMFKAKDKNLTLYCGDMLRFNKSVDGQFDCIWDRGSLVALDRKDVKEYVAIIKDILKPGGKLLVEVLEYDIAIFEGKPRPPPPFPVFEDELRSLYEPDCSVELVERQKRMLSDEEVNSANYLIVKK